MELFWIFFLGSLSPTSPPSFGCNRDVRMAHPCVTKTLFATPTGGNGGALYDRHFGVKLTHFDHVTTRVNHVAVEPTCGQMAVTVGDDCKTRVWKSRALLQKERKCSSDST